MYRDKTMKETVLTNDKPLNSQTKLRLPKSKWNGEGDED